LPSSDSRRNSGLGRPAGFRASLTTGEILRQSPWPKASSFYGEISMTWIRTVPLTEADEKLRKAMEDEKGLYPIEYATPVHPVEGGGSEIVASHSLIPDALYHAFATFGVLMSPDLPLSRRQHEMITAMVSVTNRCVY